MTNPRIMAAAGVLAVAAIAAVVLLSAGGSGDGGDEPRRTVRAKLTLERFRVPDTGRPELLISLPEARLNSPDLVRGARSVLLRCFDEEGAVTIRGPADWPLLEEPGYPLPHIHQPVQRSVLTGVRRCRLTGPGIDFEGRVPGPPPEAAL